MLRPRNNNIFGILRCDSLHIFVDIKGICFQQYHNITRYSSIHVYSLFTQATNVILLKYIFVKLKLCNNKEINIPLKCFEMGRALSDNKDQTLNWIGLAARFFCGREFFFAEDIFKGNI